MFYKRLSTIIISKNINNISFSNRRSNKGRSLLLRNYSQDFLTNDNSISLKNYPSPRNSIANKSLTRSLFNSPSISKNQHLSNFFLLSPQKIYMKLEERDKIEKIIKEEAKKIYFKQRINFGQNLSVDEFKTRLANKAPQNAYKRELARKIKEKIKLKNKLVSHFPIKKNLNNINTEKQIDLNQKINNIIKVNQKLFRNFTLYQDEKDGEQSKKNMSLVKEFIEKNNEVKTKLSIEMSKQFDTNKKELFMELDSEKIFKNDANKLKKYMDEKNFRNYRRKQFIKLKKYFEEKSKVFDIILDDEFYSNSQKSHYIKQDRFGRNKVNYKALSNKILISNLIKQMNVIYLRDPSLNLLRGNQTKKIEDLQKEVSLYDEDKELYNKNNNDILSFSKHNKKWLILPGFVKTKFKRKTNMKFGEISDNYFGIPV